MKKFGKVLIAFVVIAIIAVGAYFIFRKKDNSKIVYNNINEFCYGLKDRDKNITEEINSVIDNMLVLIEEKSMNVGSSKDVLISYTVIRDNYALVNEQVFKIGALVESNSKVDKNIKEAQTNYAIAKKIFLESYEYLKNTYYKIIDKTYNASTMASYIVNFTNIFEEAIDSYNLFYYNSAVAFAHGLKNTMQYNNQYKLKLEYFATLVSIYNNDTIADKDILSSNIDMAKAGLSNDYSSSYISSKADFDELVNNSLSMDLNELCINIAKETETDYISEIANSEQKVLVEKYMEKVVRG